MKPKWKRVGTHGQPPAESLLHIPSTDYLVHDEGEDCRDEVLYLTPDDLAALLPAPDDIEPAPLPEPWQPMETCPEGMPVLIAYEDERVLLRECSYRKYDEANGRIAWAPIPEHPGGAS